MKDEIKEILDDLRTYKDRYEYFLFNNLSFSDRDYKAKILLDYITNLQTIEQQYSVILSENVELENKITNLQKEKDKYKNVIDKIKEYCKDKIQEQKEMVDFSKYYLENYDKAISETNSSHSGILLETIKSTTIKRYEDILELLEEVE